MFLSLHVLLRSLIGRLPTYFPEKDKTEILVFISPGVGASDILSKHRMGRFWGFKTFNIDIYVFVPSPENDCFYWGRGHEMFVGCLWDWGGGFTTKYHYVFVLLFIFFFIFFFLGGGGRGGLNMFFQLCTYF